MVGRFGRSGGRRTLIATATVAALVAVLLGAVYVFQRRLIYLPDDAAVPSASRVLPSGRDVTLNTADGHALRAWYFAVDDPAATVLVAPGNGGNRSMRIPLAKALTDRGLSVLLLDYRGYGGNPGEPTEQGLALDVRAAREFLLRDADLPGGKLLYFGESLGAAVVTELAIEHPPAGLILRSPFTELADVGKHHYPFLPVDWLLEETYPLTQQVRRVPAPTTVVYGSADSIVPPGQSVTVARAAHARLVEVAGADHNDAALLDGDQLIDAVTAAVED